MSVAFLTRLIAMSGTLITGFYVCGKALNYKASLQKKSYSILWCLAWALLFYSEILPLLFIRIAYCALSAVFIWVLIRQRADTVVSAFLLSYGISNVLVNVAALIIGLIIGLLFRKLLIETTSIDINQPIYLLIFSLTAV